MKTRNDSGFVMVEAIAALGVAALAAAALMATLGAASARSDEARIRGLALRQAQMLVEEAVGSVKVEDLARRGELTRAGLTWTRSIDGAGLTYPNIQRVLVEVSWRSLRKKGATRLEAYRINRKDR